MAVNCCVAPTAMEGLIGAMSIPVRVPPEEELSPQPKESRLSRSRKVPERSVDCLRNLRRSSGNSINGLRFVNAIRVSGRHSNERKARTSSLDAVENQNEVASRAARSAHA